MLQKLILKEWFKNLLHKTTSVGKSKKVKKKKDETNEVEEIYIPPEKRQQIIDDLRLF